MTPATDRLPYHCPRVLHHLGHRLGGHGVQQATSPHPVALPEIDINLFWHARYSRHPGSVWLRGLLVGLFADAEDTRLATA